MRNLAHSVEKVRDAVISVAHAPADPVADKDVAADKAAQVVRDVQAADRVDLVIVGGPTRDAAIRAIAEVTVAPVVVDARTIADAMTGVIAHPKGHHSPMYR